MTKTEKQEVVPLKEAIQAVESVSRRLALLHLSYAKTLIEDLGEEKGKKLIAKAIKNYGTRIGEAMKREVQNQGFENTPENFNAARSYAIPRFGIHERTKIVEVEGEPRRRTYGCTLAKVWKEYGEEKLGRLYCYVDVLKFMAYNPNYKLVHIKTLPDGYEYCELAVRQTTERERKDFLTNHDDWFYMDK